MAIHSASGFRQPFLARLGSETGGKRTQIMDLSLVGDGLQEITYHGCVVVGGLWWMQCCGPIVMDVLSWTVCYGYFLLDAVS
jgi:hypothetical protein